MELRRINNEKVTPIEVKRIPPKKIKGYSQFPIIYSNIFLLAKKNSGKTNVIFSILNKCASKDTFILIFSSTVNKDDVYINGIKQLKKKGFNIMTFTSIHEDGINQLKELTEQLQQIEEGDEETVDNKVKSHIIFGDEDDEKPSRKKKKKLSAEYILVFDDLANELKDKQLSFLMKRNRHFRMKVILSSQYLFDLEKSARAQLDYILLFGSLPIEKLISIHKELDLSLLFETFVKIYKVATEKKYNFLYVSIRDDIYRKNFNEQFITSS